MECNEIYCQVDAWKRLRERGVSPSKAMDIAADVYKTVKKAVNPDGNVPTEQRKCDCETD